MNLSQLNARDAFAVTPHDTNALTKNAVALYIGGAGTGALTVKTIKGNNVSFAGIPAGFVLNLQVTHVLSTGTGVTSIVALCNE